jgi:septum site-determining protein MinC
MRQAASRSVEAPTPPKPPVSVKGRPEGLRITVREPDAVAVEASLRRQLARQEGTFFAGAPVVLELPPGPLDLVLAGRLGAVLAEAGMSLTAIVAGPLPVGAARAGAEPTPAAAPSRPEAALWVSRTLRSGQRIVHDGPVVVLGDVNAGAEVIAGGSVVVWGRLRGVVEAGLAGPAEGAAVCALDLAPTQLRIGDALARAPEEPDRVPVPEVARVVEGHIVVDEWRA